MANRFIGESTRPILDLLEIFVKLKINFYLVIIDIDKAFYYSKSLSLTQEQQYTLCVILLYI